MLVSRRFLRLNQLLLRVLGLDGRHDLRNPCKAFHAFKLLLAVQQHRPSHRWSMALPRVRVIFRSLYRTNENRLSIGLVDSSVVRSNAGTFSRWSVSNSSKASRSESAADSFLVRSHASSFRSICLASV